MNANGNDPVKASLLASVALPAPHDTAAAKPLADELIWETGPIGEEVGLKPREAYHLLRTGALPAQKIGGRWCASRSALRKHFAAVLGESAA